MSTSPWKAQSMPTDEVDRAVAAVRRAIGRLIQLLDHEDDDVVLATGIALDTLGGRAVVGPLSAALSRAGSIRHRALIVQVLKSLGPEVKPAVLPVLLAAKERERDPRVLATIHMALNDLLLSDLDTARTRGTAPPEPTSGAGR